MYIPLDKQVKKALEYVKKAVSKDDARPQLMEMNIGKNVVAGSNGLAAHFVQLSVPSPRNIRGHRVVTIKGNVAEISDEQENGTYPDLIQVIPGGEPFCEFSVNAKLFVDALSSFGECLVIIRVRVTTPKDGSKPYVTQPITINGRVEEQNAFALVMPMSILSKEEAPEWYTWTPTKI